MYNEIQSDLGYSNITNIGFSINLSDRTIKSEDVILSKCLTNTKIVFSGEFDYIKIDWIFNKCEVGYIVTLEINSQKPLNCISIDNIIFEVPLEEKMNRWKVPMFGNYLLNTGVKNLGDLHSCKYSARATGLFEDMSIGGIMISQIIPLKFVFNINVQKLHDRVLFSSNTKYTNNYVRKNIVSQSTWLCADCTPNEGVEFISKLVPISRKIKPKIKGWNSWDYYFTTVSHDNIVENLEFVNGNKELKENLKYIIIDDGWEHKWGEWENNYKFKKGMKYTAEIIKKSGFIPGIWTAPLQIDPLSYPALREYEMLIKDNFGDPFICPDTNFYLVDPTHPKGKEYISKLYRNLYKDGYRLFKVDFVASVLEAGNFYNKNFGHYDIIREIFSIIRENITEECHIIGCSLPPECGANVADSGRIGIDIHNCWTHIEWVIDAFEWASIYHNKLWKTDLDFLIIRGSDTTIEKNTNVLNPKKMNQKLNKRELDELTFKWRNGNDFNYYEAETWANFVSVSGGNIILSDRLCKLNNKGLNLIINALKNQSENTIKPYYLKGDKRASLWKSEKYIMIINWEDKMKSFNIDLKLGDNKRLYSNKGFIQKAGQIITELRAHESIVISIL